MYVVVVAADIVAVAANDDYDKAVVGDCIDADDDIVALRQHLIADAMVVAVRQQ